MTIAKSPQFKSFEAYLAAEPGELPEGRYEYDDGELIPLMAESELNNASANFLFLTLVNLGIPFRLIQPHSCEIEVPGRPRTRIPDLTVLDEAHIPLLQRRSTITRDMPPPRLLVEVVSPSSENSENYRRDYQDKAMQYAQIGVPEYWLIDPQRSVVAVGSLSSGTYQFARFMGQEAIVSPTFPELNLTAAQLLKLEEV